MPTYSYRCTECSTAFDIQQAFTDDSLTECPTCEGRLRKVFSSIGVTFNGSGFYRTDSRAAERSSSGSSSGSDSGGSGSKGSSTTDSSSSSTPAKKETTSSGSGSGSGSSTGSGTSTTAAAAS